MNTDKHFKSLAAEIEAVKDRVQNLIGSAHWPTVGAWRESVLRSILRRHLPSSLQIGSGFVISPSGLSSQIDILIFDDTGPTIFRDGDLVIVTPEMVRAVIEVKTRVLKVDLMPTLSKMVGISKLLRNSHSRNSACPFVGLFSYEDENLDPNAALQDLQTASLQPPSSFPINCLALGRHQFVRHWPYSPYERNLRTYDRWHFYQMGAVAHAYFAHNVIEHLFPQSVAINDPLWYPEESKEVCCVADIWRDHR